MYSVVGSEVYEDEGKGEEGHAEEHADQGAEEEGATAHAVDEAECDDGREEVGEGDENGEGDGLTESRQLDNLGRAVGERSQNEQG